MEQSNNVLNPLRSDVDLRTSSDNMLCVVEYVETSAEEQALIDAALEVAV